MSIDFFQLEGNKNKIKNKQLCFEVVKVVQYIDYCLIVFIRHETGKITLQF